MSKICDRKCQRCLDGVLDDLAAIEDGEERLEYLVDLAKDTPCLKDDFKQDCFKVNGCLSNLWIVPELRDGKCYFHCDCDAMIPKGIAFVLAAFHSGYSPQEVLNLDLNSIIFLMSDWDGDGPSFSVLHPHFLSNCPGPLDTPAPDQA